MSPVLLNALYLSTFVAPPVFFRASEASPLSPDPLCHHDLPCHPCPSVTIPLPRLFFPGERSESPLSDLRTLLARSPPFFTVTGERSEPTVPHLFRLSCLSSLSSLSPLTSLSPDSAPHFFIWASAASPDFFSRFYRILAVLIGSQPS